MWENVEEQRMRRDLRRSSTGSRQRRRWSLALVFSSVGGIVSVGVGSWWTATAVADGAPAWTLARFVLTIVVGTYYLLWFNNSRNSLRLLDVAADVRAKHNIP